MFIIASIFTKVASYFAGGFLKSLLDVGLLILKYALEFVSWYLSNFWKGLGVIFHNLSTLTVVLAVAVGSAWYFKSWDNDKVLKECIRTCPTPIITKVYTNPIKKKIFGDTLPKPTAKQDTKKFTPFNMDAP